jgi:hypothetical protein
VFKFSGEGHMLEYAGLGQVLEYAGVGFRCLNYSGSLRCRSRIIRIKTGNGRFWKKKRKIMEGKGLV